jgi:hypothetical protein
MTITRGLAYGNMGQQYKVGGALPVIQNSLIVGNCGAMSGVIPGTPTGYNTSLTDFCRAGNTAILMEFPPGTTSLFEFNTIYSGGNIALEIEPWDSGPAWAGTELFKYVNNTFLGFFNSGHGSNATPIFSNVSLAPLTFAGSSWTHNAELGGAGSGWTCPMTGESSQICGSPGLVDETYHAFGFGNMTPSSGSSAVSGAGVTIAGITTDYAGVTRPNPPAIGALEFTGTAPTLVSMALTPNPSTVTVGSTRALTCTSTFSDSSTAPCSGPTWVSATPAKATINSSGVVTGVATGTSIITASIGAITSPGDTITVNAAPSAPVAIHGHSKISGRVKFH